jgi:hypothetical protein
LHEYRLQGDLIATYVEILWDRKFLNDPCHSNAAQELSLSLMGGDNVWNIGSFPLSRIGYFFPYIAATIGQIHEKCGDVDLSKKYYSLSIQSGGVPFEQLYSGKIISNIR